MKLPSALSLRRLARPASPPTAAPLPLPSPPLARGELALRAWHPSDAADRAKAMSDPESHRWTDLPLDYPVAEAAHDIAGGVRLRKTGQRVPLAITEADEIVGAIDLMVLAPGRAEIGYIVAPWARRRRVATRAVELLSDWAASELGFERLELPVPVGNVASQGVAEAAGFTREGELRSFLRLREGGPLVDVMMWSRITKP